MITLAAAAFAPGGTVKGTVSGSRATDRADERVVVWLVWHLTNVDSSRFDSEARTTEDYAVVARSDFPAAPSITFEFPLPAEGPVSYAGQLFRIDWDIVVGTDSKAGGVAVHEHLTFEVAPASARKEASPLRSPAAVS